MKITELTIGQGNVDVEGTITDIGETKTFNKFGRDLSVANAMLKDESGSIKLTLWNDDVSRFKDGDKIKVSNGYVNEFQGEKQLTAGKFGSMELVEGGSDSGEKQESTDETPSEPSSEETSESSEPTSEETSEEPKEVEVTETTESEEPKEVEETTF